MATELAFEGMVCCTYHGRAVGHIKASSERAGSIECDSVSVRMLCAIFRSTSNGYLCRPNADSFSSPHVQPN